MLAFVFYGRNRSVRDFQAYFKVVNNFFLDFGILRSMFGNNSYTIANILFCSKKLSAVKR